MHKPMKTLPGAALAALVSLQALPAAVPVLAAETPAAPALLPQPVSMRTDGTWLNVSSAALINEEQADAAAVRIVREALEEHGISVVAKEEAQTWIALGEQSDENAELAAWIDQAGLDSSPLKAGGYVLASGTEEGHTWIALEGVDEAGTFYGAQTFRQLLSESSDGVYIQKTSITDEPSMAVRGSIEGFYAHSGPAWTWKQRQEQVRFYGETKMNTYIYAPKDDPYHRSQWRNPYPQEDLEGLKATAKAAAENHVNFVFALSPGNDIDLSGSNKDADFEALVNKFETMYEAGVRSFAVFFDDISMQANAGVLQAEFLNRLNVEFVKAKGDVTPLITVPTQYDSLAMRSGTEISEYTSSFSQTLDNDIIVLWTGTAVVPDGIHKEDAEFVQSIYGDRLGIWWNYPCNDYILNKLAMGPIYNLDNELTEMLDTFVMNPMGDAELSKITLGTGADYSWNGSAYDAQTSYENTIDHLYGDLADDMMIFAKHSSRLAGSSFSCGREDAPDVRALMDTVLSQAAGVENIESLESYQNLKKEFEAMVSASANLKDGLSAEALANSTGNLDKLAAVGQADLQALELLKAKVNEDEETVSSLTSALAYTPSSLLSGKRISENTGVKFVSDVLAYEIEPQAGFTLEKTLALPGQEVQLINTSSLSASEFEWKMPGAVVSSSAEKNPVVRYDKEGIYTITLTAKNRFGEDTEVLRQCIVVSSQANQEIVNLALNKPATASGRTGSAEAPDKAVDGLETSKWCTTNWGSKWLQIDLEEEKNLTGFAIKHASVGGEGAALNTKAYRIQVSNDGSTFTDLVTVTNNTEGHTIHSVPLTTARYVRLAVDTPTQGSDSAARIFEFEIYGLETPITMPEVYAANKTLLAAAIEYAQAAQAEESYAHVNELVKTRFEAALLAAKNVNENPDADQDQVNEAWKELTGMIQMLGFTSDKGALAQAISLAEGVEAALDEYTGNKEEFTAALEHARSVFASETALDESIQAALARLNAAMDGLVHEVPEIDYTMLRFLVETCEGLDLNLYVEQGKEAYQAALQNAKDLIGNASIQQQVDEAQNTLHETMLALRLKADESLLRQLADFAAQAGSIDRSLYSAEELSVIDKAVNDVNLALADSQNLKQEDAEKLADSIAKAKALVEENRTASASASKAEQGKAASVKTSAASGWMGWSALMAASAALLLRRKRR